MSHKRKESPGEPHQHLINYLHTTVLASLREEMTDECMLRKFVKSWSNHTVMVTWLSDYYRHLHIFVRIHTPSYDLTVVGLTWFIVAVYEHVKGQVKDAVLRLVDRQRDGEHVDRDLLKKVTYIIFVNTMGCIESYNRDFEEPFILNAGNYYAPKAVLWIEEKSCRDYLFKVQGCLEKEKHIASLYLAQRSEIKLLEVGVKFVCIEETGIVQDKLLVNYANHLLENEIDGFGALVRHNKVVDLSRMYRLYHRIPRALDSMVNMFNQYVTTEFFALVQLANEAVSRKKLLRDPIELHDKYMQYVTRCFSNNRRFEEAVAGAFQRFCDEAGAGSSIAEMLASFCDTILREGRKGILSYQAIEETSDKVVRILAYTSDKDLFAEIYRMKLSDRLLSDMNTGSDVHERLILSKLKYQYGHMFTLKMDQMVTDLTLSNETQNHFQEYLLNTTVSPTIDFSITILTTGSWPTYKSSGLLLPTEMVHCMKRFEEFYNTQTQQRKKLTWIHSIGTCSIMGTFESNTIELVVSPFLAAVLLLFNDSDRLSYTAIKTQLKVSDQRDVESLLQSLHSLSSAKHKILIKEPSSSKITATDYFTFNSKFTDQRSRIKVTLPRLYDRKQVVIDKDRRFCIDASLVRIMKHRRTFSFQELVAECTKQLSRTFRPKMRMINLRIEDLILREFLKRDEEDKSMLNYVDNM